MGSAAGSAVGSAAAATGSNAAGALDLCTVAKQDAIEAAIGPLVGRAAPEENPKHLAPGAAGVTGCSFELANRMITVEAKPAADFDTLAAVDKKHSTEIKGLGEKAYANDRTGVIVKLAGKPYFLHILSDAGGPPDNKVYENKTATSLAKVLVAAIK